ncbi:GNAT family N-acetyltransferase [Ammoniphilus sp. YIM 78166]|uniref:GNAT family N-acetyltransferase n=1 Tax=Ammoniphilus sp. YIM 78166 TaxID=1644106 RepID=UPI00106FBD3F|nr:GNAT family N-acetyltransferase [Ammoniphilus sp. YIM 78166]
MDNPSNLPTWPEINVRLVSSTEEKNDAHFVRHAVFVHEQKVPAELEYDSHDDAPTTLHFVAYNENSPIGAARIRTYAPGIAKVERVAVMSSNRGAGIGAMIMKRIEEQAASLGYTRLKLNSQLQAVPFYRRLGYESVGDVFVEADIEHLAMEKELEA